jgi:hypothetical protein
VAQVGGSAANGDGSPNEQPAGDNREAHAHETATAEVIFHTIRPRDKCLAGNALALAGSGVGSAGVKGVRAPCEPDRKSDEPQEES